MNFARRDSDSDSQCRQSYKYTSYAYLRDDSAVASLCWRYSKTPSLRQQTPELASPRPLDWTRNRRAGSLLSPWCRSLVVEETEQ